MLNKKLIAMFIQVFLRVVWVFAIFSISSCATDFKISFNSLKYPVSMSHYLYGIKGKIAKNGKGLNALKDFEYTTSFCNTLYSIVGFSKNDELIEVMNSKIESAGGDGMTNASVLSDTGFGTGAPFLSALPFWPACTIVTVTGTIVKFEQY